MATEIRKGNISIAYDIIPERKKPVFGFKEGNMFFVYGQFHNEKVAEEFMTKLAEFFGVNGGAKDG